jgi:hypothetical protein
MPASALSVQTSANRRAAVSRGSHLFRDIIPADDEAGHWWETLDVLDRRVSPGNWRAWHFRMPGWQVRAEHRDSFLVVQRSANGLNLWILCF